MEWVSFEVWHKTRRNYLREAYSFAFTKCHELSVQILPTWKATFECQGSRFSCEGRFQDYFKQINLITIQTKDRTHFDDKCIHSNLVSFVVAIRFSTQ
jgi:hypothetical protein